MKKKLRPHDVDVILFSNLSFFYLNRSNVLLSIYLNLLPITNTLCLLFNLIFNLKN